MFDVFSNERFVNSLVKENKTLAQKICDFIKELLSEIRNMMKNYHNSPEMESLRDMKALLDNINNIFVYELEIASNNAQKAKNAELQSTAENREQKNNTTEDGGVKYAYRLTEKDLDNYLKAGNRKNKNKITALKNNQKIILTSNEEVKNYINNSIDKKTDGVTVAYGLVDDRLVNDVAKYSKNKIKIDNNYLELIPGDIQHSYEEHHKAKEIGDIDLSRNDFENIPEYFDSYDELLYAITYASGQTKICVSKFLPEGRILIIETVSKSRGAVQFKNAIGVTEEKYQQEYVSKYKKRNSENARGNDSSNISLRDSTVSDTNVPQNADSVNNNSMQNQQNNAEIKKSLKLSADAKKVLEENTELKSAFLYFQSQFKLVKDYIPSEEQLMNYAKQLKKSNASTKDVYEIKNDLRNIYSILHSMTDSRGLEYATNTALKLATDIMVTSKVLDEQNQAKQELRKQLNETMKML